MEQNTEKKPSKAFDYLSKITKDMSMKEALLVSRVYLRGALHVASFSIWLRLATTILLVLMLVNISLENWQLKKDRRLLWDIIGSQTGIQHKLVKLWNQQEKMCDLEKRVLHGMYNRDSTNYVKEEDRPQGGLLFPRKEAE